MRSRTPPDDLSRFAATARREGSKTRLCALAETATGLENGAVVCAPSAPAGQDAAGQRTYFCSELIRTGVDVGNNYFQLHALETEDWPPVARKLSRKAMRRLFAGLEPCLAGMEACASSHYWAHELMAMGHHMRLIPPICVKPYVKRGKNCGGRRGDLRGHGAPGPCALSGSRARKTKRR